MTVWLNDWYRARSQRERRLLQLMAAFAVPLLIWLLIAVPLDRAYDEALQRHLQAVDRNARVKALAARGGAGGAGQPAAVPDLPLFLTDSALQRGLTAVAQAGPAPATASVSIASGPAPIALEWLRGLEQQGLRITDVRITPAGGGAVAVTANISGRAQ